MYRKFLLRQSIPMFKSEHLQCLFLWASSFSQHQSRPIWLLCLWCLYPGLASLCHTCTLGTLRLSINWVEVFRILECCFTLLKTKAKITMNRVTCVSKYNGERDKKRPEDHLKHLCMGHIWRGDKCNICPRWRPQEVERQRQTRSDNYLADKTLDMPLDVQSLESPVSYRPVTSKTLWQNLLSIALITESRTPCSNEVITVSLSSWICHQSSVICDLTWLPICQAAGELHRAAHTLEALWVPVLVHRLDTFLTQFGIICWVTSWYHLIPGWCTDHIWRKRGQTASCNHLGSRAYHASCTLWLLKKYCVKSFIYGWQILFTWVCETHLTHRAGEVVLVIEPLPRLHGPVGDVLRADGADHSAHDDSL